MAQAFNKWLKPALANLPGALRSVTRTELAAAVREFYEKSAALRETVSRDVVAGISSYAVLSDDSAMVVVKPLTVSYNERGLDILMRKPDRITYPSGSPTGWYRTGVNVVNLWPKPVEAITSGMSIYLTLRPDTSTDSLPDISFEEHFDAIFDGFMGRMYRQPAKAYSNLQLADYHMKRFRAAIAEAKGLANRGNVPAGVGWRFNSFGK